MPDPDDDNTENPDRPRLVINVGDRAQIALEAVAEATGWNKTTILNQAVKLYAELRALHAAGGKILIQQPGSRDWEQLIWPSRDDHD